ncbi:MAG: NifB/NifX family molybdenum-iron cluster-binding protein [Candidatus Asgardarchaeia archaeon]
MKIAVATQGNGGLNDTVSPIFGRTNTFTIVEVEETQIKQVTVQQNPAVMAVGGAGPQAAQILASLGVEVVIAGSFGPNATMALSALGIKMIPVTPGTSVKDAVEQLIQGKLPASAPPSPQPYISPIPYTSTPLSPFPSPVPLPTSNIKDLEVRYLEEQIKMLEEQLKQIDARIKELKSLKK